MLRGGYQGEEIIRVKALGHDIASCDWKTLPIWCCGTNINYETRVRQERLSKLAESGQFTKLWNLDVILLMILMQ